MSDERDGAGSAGDDTDTADDTEGRGSTAVAAPSQQPKGKRSQRSATDDETDSKAASKSGSGKKAAKKGESRTNPFVYVATFLKQVVAELRKVIWPNRKEMISYTSVVLVFLVFMVALIAGFDLGWAKLVTLIFG